MIGVTEEAKVYLKTILDSNATNPEESLRLKLDNSGQLGLAIDTLQSNDKAVEYEGGTLLVVEQSLADSLDNMAIDVKATEDGNQLVIDEKAP